MALAGAVLDGEKTLFASWADSIAAVTPALLREPVLRRGVATEGEPVPSIAVNYSPALLEATTRPAASSAMACSCFSSSSPCLHSGLDICSLASPVLHKTSFPRTSKEQHAKAQSMICNAASWPACTDAYSKVHR